jgi:hypothetical protein
LLDDASDLPDMNASHQVMGEHPVRMLLNWNISCAIYDWHDDSALSSSPLPASCYQHGAGFIFGDSWTAIKLARSYQSLIPTPRLLGLLGLDPSFQFLRIVFRAIGAIGVWWAFSLRGLGRQEIAIRG